jgi:DNA-binding Lrp family transcriptional regulator
VPQETPAVSLDRYTIHTDGVTCTANAMARAEPRPVRPDTAVAVSSTTAHSDASIMGRFGTPPPRRASTAAAFETAIAELPQVRHAERLFGDPDYLLRVAARDLDDFAALRDQSLATLPGIHRLTSTIVMKRIVDNRPLPLATRDR